jgi:glycosyltransferase involved in cell wall biosynthesis
MTLQATDTLAPERNATHARTRRVLFALCGLHRVVRGAEVAFEEVSRQIAMRPGFDVTLIGSGEARPDTGYRYLRAGCVRRERFEGWPSLPGLRDHYGYEELSFAPGLLRTYSPAEFDVTVTCSYPYTNWILRSRRGVGGPKHVFVTQNGDGMVRNRNWEYRYFGCDGLVCTNPEYFEAYRDRWRCALIPNGVDPRVFSPGPAHRNALQLPESAPVILMVSALTSSKRVLEGVSAAAVVPDAYLLIAGDGELREEVQELGNRLMPGRFRLTTFPRSQMPRVYNSVDVLLHMSQDEPSANTYIEALACGLPIITHDRYVTRWTLEDNAVLVNTSDQEAVADALIRGLKMKRPSDVTARRDLVNRRFSWSSIAEQYCDFFEAIE